MNLAIASVMFIFAGICAIRALARNETEPMNAAGLFCLAACVLLK